MRLKLPVIALLVAACFFSLDATVKPKKSKAKTTFTAKSQKKVTTSINNSSENEDETLSPQFCDESEFFCHKVAKGETLKSIAQIYDVTIIDLIKWNDLATSKIIPGQIIKIKL